MKHDIKQSNESPMSGYLKHTISFVAGFLIAIFAEPLQHFLFRPALHLEFIHGGSNTPRLAAALDFLK